MSQPSFERDVPFAEPEPPVVEPPAVVPPVAEPDFAQQPAADLHHAEPVTPPETTFDPRNPSEEFLRREIEANHRAERALVFKAIAALALVVVLVIVREWVFVQ